MYNHIIDRNLVEWTSFGKFGNEPARHTLIKDLSDSHLLHVIEHIRSRKLFKFNNDDKILDLMEKEAKYRQENYIFVPETY